MKPHVFAAAFALFAAFAACSLAADDASKDAAPKPDKDGWYSLFNGKDLTGWKVSTDNPDTFKVVDGEIVAHGPAAHLFYEGPVNKANFKNFEWKCEIMTKPHSNSGMYFHTKYQEKGWPAYGIEIQVNQTHADAIKSGSVYRLKNVMDKSPVKDNEWYTQDVTVKGYDIVVKINDKVVNEYTQPKDLAREGIWVHNVMSPSEGGTICLQGHDPDSETHYRKVMIKPLP